MKRIGLFLIAVTMLSLHGISQAQTRLESYVLIVGSINYSSIAGVGQTLSFSSTDDGYATCNLPFAMPFGTTTIAANSQIACSANGFLYLGEGSASGTTASTSGHKVIHPILGNDGYMGRISGAQAYKYFNPADSSFTIEYKGLNTYSSPYGTFNYQVVMYPSGNIIINFGQLDGGAMSTARCYLSNSGSDNIALSGSWQFPTTTSSTTSNMPVSPLPENMSYSFFRELGPCPGPNRLRVTHLTSDSCILRWTELGSASQWVLEYADSVFVPGAYQGTAIYPTDSMAVLEYLDPATTYYVYLHSDCVSDTSLNRSLVFTTRCLPVDHYELPYSYGFEDMVSGRLNVCWSTGSIGSGYLPTGSTAGARSGQYNMYLKSYNTSAGYLASPRFDDPANTLQISFYGKRESTSYNGSFVVGTMTDPSQPSTFHAIDTVTPASGSLVWEYFEVDLNAAPDPDHYVAIHMCCSTSYNYGYIDDITIRTIPTCRRVANLSVTNVTQHTADLSWTDPNSVGQYLIEYGPEGFEQGSGTYDLSYSPSYTMTGLSASLRYGVYVYCLCGSDTSNGYYTTFTTPCGDYTRSAMPITYGFEDATGSGASYSINQCWARHTDYTTAYPYPYSTYVHSGSYSLYFYGSSTYYCYLVMPPVEDSVQDLMVSCWLYTTSSSYGLEVGVMTHPDSLQSFVTLATLRPSATSTWEEVYATFASYTDTGRYIAFRAINGVTCYAYLDDITLDLAPSCHMPENLNAQYSQVNNNIVVSWDAPSSGDPAVQYYVRYKMRSESTWTVDSTLSTYYIIQQPADFETYNIQVITGCDDGNSFRLSTSVATGSCQAVGLGDISTNYTPICSYNSCTYTYSQQLYTRDQMTSVGDSIYGVYFNVSSFSSTNAERKIKVWVGETSWGSYTANNQYVPLDSLTLVYDSVWTLNSGWCLINFQTPYVRDVNRGFVVAMLDSTGTVASAYFYGDLTDLYYAIFAANTSYVNPRNPQGSVAGRVNGTAQTRFYAPCRTLPCAPPTVLVGTVMPTSVDLSWIPSGSESTWAVEYRASLNDPWQMVAPSVSTNNYTVTGLRPGTQYHFRVTALCSGEEGQTTVSAYTECAPQPIPFTEDFESYIVGTFSHPCWNYSGGTPSITGLSGYNDGNLVRTSDTYLALPRMAVSLDSLQVSVTVRTGAAARALIGYSPDLNFANHFVTVDTLSDPTESGTFNVVSFAGVQNASGYIVLYSPTALAASNYIFYDNIEVDYIDQCPAVRSLTASNITTTTAQVSWVDMGSNSTSYIVEYDTAGFTLGTGRYRTVSSNTSVTLNGLTPSTYYDFYVYAVCGLVGDTSDSRQRGRFSTSCLPTTVAAGTTYTEDFEGNVCPPECWSALTSPGNGIALTTSQAHGGSQSFRFSSYSSATTYDQYLISPEFQLASAMDMAFYHRAENASYPEIFRVGYSTNSNDTVDFVWSQWDSASTTWQEFVYTVPANTKYVAIHYNTTESAGTYYLYIDDFVLRAASPCNQPTSLQATTTDVTATLSWSGTASSYEVSVRQNGASTWPAESVARGNSYTATGLTANTQYEWRVRSVCGSVSSNWVTGTFTTQPPSTTPCDAPTGLATSSTTTTSATVSWSGSGNFEVAYKAASSSSWSTETSVSATTYTFNGLNANTQYNWRVRKVCSANDQSDWATGTFTTQQGGGDPDPCDAPTGLSVANVTSSSATVSWSGSGNFEVAYKTTASSSWSNANQVSASSYTISGLTANTQYDWRVRKVCSATEQSDWASGNFTTESGEGITATEIGGVSVAIYPNPASRNSDVEVSIKGANGEVSVTLLDITGRTLQHSTQSCQADCTKHFDLHGVARGTYFVKVQTEGSTKVQKLVVR
ncbi:MAG: fibronectin type III domain-containing protein [Bacteroidales bacterium]|nr:fibronectin type III domain-containing protein [Bacteroidales bacterium]